MAETWTNRPVAILPPGEDEPDGVGIVLKACRLRVVLTTPKGRRVLPPHRVEPLGPDTAEGLGLEVVHVESHLDRVLCPHVKGGLVHSDLVSLAPVGLHRVQVGLCPTCWRFFVMA